MVVMSIMVYLLKFESGSIVVVSMASTRLVRSHSIDRTNNIRVVRLTFGKLRPKGRLLGRSPRKLAAPDGDALRGIDSNPDFGTPHT